MIRPIFGSSDPMRFVLQPWQLFFLILAGWVNREQQAMIEFQNAQIRILMQKMGRKRILLTDDQRRILAVKGKALGRKKNAEGTDHDRDSGYDHALAPPTDRGEMGLHRP